MTDEEKAILDFAGLVFVSRGVQATEIRKRFGCTSTVYFQRLLALIETPEALAYAPSTVRRHQRLRDRYRAARRPA
jgi:hypothetical protein